MTHTFEIEIGGLSVQGEISFNGSAEPSISMDEKPTDMPLKNYKRIGEFLSKCVLLYRQYGEIGKIEIVKK